MAPSDPPTVDNSEHKANSQSANEFQSAADEPELGLVREFWLFLRENKAWWMVPILLCLAILAFAVWFGGTPLAPFIYPLF